ncbi:TetR/AcrR family transcriptional regulator [Stackebrandtia nassauensis]|uniref:Transcriptional regulator, TetR family n=1 Tax=Stackebrandtia nassauensis (strain DSM 44728 / CIP 108903 / NRRL B-16338 / NBRC 102104 / LLR-40K-21) TaxID=446470 RepID=D3PZH7_STANL|nr:TetR/AcrR family transcriptional regulator [Stackebrandtia nassauensis]ADD41651.1 transcriptional regulator, TetR family [Stackebrandtia nassauensis DSM 44728]
MAKPTAPGKAEAAAQTRDRLVSRARSLFARRGYADVGLTEIVAHAGVTKGALYHHFDSKADLFRAVIAQVHDEVGERVAAAAEASEDPWEQLLHGCDAFLRASVDPVTQRILLIDGPAVLGWREWKALDASASERHLTEMIEELIEEEVLPTQPVKPLVHLLSGAMNEAALWLAHASGPDDIAATMRALTAMLDGLRRPGAK